MFWFRAWLLAWAVLALGCPPALAGGALPGPGGSQILLERGWLQAVQPSENRVAWSRRPGGGDGGALVPLSDEVWLLTSSSRVEAFSPKDGRLLWSRDFEREGTELVWGPEPLGGTGRLALAVADGQGSGLGARVEVLEPATGEPLWTYRSDQELVRARAWGGDLLLQVRPGQTSASAAGGYLRAETTAEVSAQADGAELGRLILVEGQGGQARWEFPLQGALEGAGWLLGDRLLMEEQGTRALLGVDRRGNRWRLYLGGPLAIPPVADPARGCLYFVEEVEGAGGEPQRLIRAGLARGQVDWSVPLPHPLALGAEGLALQGGQLSLLLQPEVDERAGPRVLARRLDPETGRVLSDAEVAGAPAQVIRGGDRLWLAQKLSSREPALDDRGRPILELADGQPRRRFVEGYRLVEVAGGRARALSEDPRAALSGPVRLEGERLQLLLKREPTRREGEPREVDPRHPEPPLLLEVWDVRTGRLGWAWGSDGGRLVGPGQLLEGTLYLPLEGGRLAAVDPATGQTRWQTSEAMVGGVGALSSAPGGRLFTITAEAQAYLLDRGTGAQVSRLDLVPIFKAEKLNNLVGVLLLTASIAWFIYSARRRDLFIRRIAGLNALDEAVGRSTEMGKPVLYVTGLADVDDIQTLASLSILGHVARKTAEYDTPIFSPHCRSVVMSMAQEVVKEAYTAVGRPDAFQRDNVRYLTDEQFGFTAGVNGIMMRDKPAANFYMGTFYAESLILAETGNATGAIQIAGTASAAQLPFFVAACDYTLIGEELFAASAYLSRDPLQVGSLKGQDAGKAVIMASILAGAVLFSGGFAWIKELFATS